MSPKRLRKGLLDERRISTRTRRHTSNVMMENKSTPTVNNCSPKLRIRKIDGDRNSLVSSAKQTKRRPRAQKETASSVKPTTPKDMSSKNDRGKSRMLKQSLSNEDIANILNHDTLIMSTASSAQSSASTSLVETTNTSFLLNNVIKNTLSESDIVTPKSSPIVVSLTPHRSKKTPKKSPIVSASPKTHTKAPLRLSKTPRKLAITADSPHTSDTSSSLNTPSPQMSGKNISTPVQSLHNSLDMKSSSDKKSKRKRSFSAKFTPLRRFSKSPKIVIRTPKSKSKYKSPKQKLSIGKRSHIKIPIIRISPVKEPPLSESRTSLTPVAAKSPKAQKSKAFSRKAMQSAAKTFGIKIPNKVSTVYVAAILNQPKVLLENVSVPRPARKRTPAKETPKSKDSLLPSPRVRIQQTLDLTQSPLPLRKTSPRATSSPFHLNQSYSKASSSGKEHLDDTFSKTLQLLDESQPLLYDSLLMSNKEPAAETSKNSLSETNKESTVVQTEQEGPADETYDLLEPKTPDLRYKCRKRSSLQADLTSPTDTAKKTCKVRFANPLFNRNSKTPTPSPLQMKRLQSANLSHSKHPRIQTSLSIRKSKATEALKHRQNRSVPALSSSGVKKRSSSVTNLVTRKALLLPDKRRSKSLSDTQVKPLIKSQQKAHPSALKSKVGSTGMSKQGSSKNATPGSPFTSHTKLNPMPNGVESESTKRRSIALSNVSSTSTKFTRSHHGSFAKKLDQSKLTMSSTKKSDVKTPIAKKVPNFAQIHQKKFAEMESLVDAKKRIADRHIALSMKVPSKSKTNTANSLVSQTKDGIYNRFGFKLNKNDAMHIISRNQHINVRQKAQDMTRAMLRGVRINRRFELQMKLRKLNI